MGNEEVRKLVNEKQVLTTKMEQVATETNQQKLGKLKTLERELASHKVVQESCNNLRIERDGLMKEIRDANMKVQALQKQNSPILNKNRELTVTNSALTAEKKMLKEEVGRWKERCEKAQQSPMKKNEEVRKLVNEKQVLTTKMEQVNKALNSSKSEILML